MPKDDRATQFGRYLESGKASPDAIRIIAYILMEKEADGDLEIFISEEVDALG